MKKSSRPVRKSSKTEADAPAKESGANEMETGAIGPGPVTEDFSIQDNGEIATENPIGIELSGSDGLVEELIVEPESNPESKEHFQIEAEDKDSVVDLEQATVFQAEPESKLRDRAEEVIPEIVSTDQAFELQASRQWKQPEKIKVRILRGSIWGEYLLEWDSLPGIEQYEVQAFFSGTQQVTPAVGAGLLLKDLAPGYHTFRVRAVAEGVPEEWDAIESSAINVPASIVTAPTKVRVISNKNKSITVQWQPVKGTDVDQYRVFELVEKERRLVCTVGDLDRCLIQSESLAHKMTFVVCAVNWSGEGPASRPVTYDPVPKKTLFEILKQKLAFLKRSAAKPDQATKPIASIKPTSLTESKPDTFRCKTRDEVCLEVTRRLQKLHIRMVGLQIEQKYEGTDEYRSIDKRNTTELISLNLQKGPEYRMIIYGSKGETWTVPITFDRRTWDFILTFNMLQNKK